jgi:hypothetical protein
MVFSEPTKDLSVQAGSTMRVADGTVALQSAVTKFQSLAQNLETAMTSGDPEAREVATAAIGAFYQRCGKEQQDAIKILLMGPEGVRIAVQQSFFRDMYRETLGVLNAAKETSIDMANAFADWYERICPALIKVSKTTVTLIAGLLNSVTDNDAAKRRSKGSRLPMLT